MEGENGFDNNITHGAEHKFDGTNNVFSSIETKQFTYDIANYATKIQDSCLYIQIHIADVFDLRNSFNFPISSFKIIARTQKVNDGHFSFQKYIFYIENIKVSFN